GAQPDRARRVPLRLPDDVPGRAAAHLRLRRLPGRPRPAGGAGGLGRGRRRAGRRRRRGAAAGGAAAAAEGRRLGIGLACYVEGTGVGPYEGGHVHVETNGRVMVATGLTSQGQGHETVFAQIVADELGVDVADVYVTTGDTRRFPYAVGTYAGVAAQARPPPPLPLRGRDLRQPGRGDERQRRGAGGPGGAGQGRAHRGRG